MSLYGALFGGVSGLRAQASRIATISDNIANVNTVGYKQARATFSSLVVNGSNNAISYQTGGVRAGTRYDISRSGLLASTESSTDIAIAGAGFFVVRSTAEVVAGDSSSQPLFTRAGRFTQDERANFVNEQGFFLQGWPLDRDGRLPGEPGNTNTTAFTNFDSLETVNVEDTSGLATATTRISLIGVNLQATEDIFPGQDATIVPDINDVNNFNVNAQAILVGDEYGLATANNLHRGDQFEINTGLGLSYDYEYGGFTIGRDINTAGSVGDTGISNTAPVAFGFAGTNVRTVAALSGVVEITIPNHGLLSGDQINLAGFAAAIDGITPAELNAGPFVVQVTGLNTFTITTTGSATAGNVSSNPAGPTADIRQFAGRVLDANTPTQAFLAISGVAEFTPAALNFTITTPTTGTVTFRYVNASPNAVNGEFNSLATLASAIDEVNGLTARVVGGRLVVSAENASESISFGNGDDVGSFSPGLRGIDWVRELGLQDIATGNRRFNSLQGLATLVNGDAGLGAEVENPLSNSSLIIRVDDPQDTLIVQDLQTPPVATTIGSTEITITSPAPAATPVAGDPIEITFAISPATAGLAVGDFVNIQDLVINSGAVPAGLLADGNFEVIATTAGTDFTIRAFTPTGFTVPAGGGPFDPLSNNNRISVLGVSNQGSVTSALGLTSSLLGGAFTPQSTGVLGPRYDSSGTVGQNLASGDLTAQFSRNVTIFDSLGAGHDLRLSFIKVAVNTWAVEVHALPPTDINTALPDGQVATGTVSFNGDGSLRSVSSGLTAPVTINWLNGALPSTLNLDLGNAGQPFGTPGATSIGDSSGLGQSSGAYDSQDIEQNGAPVGELVSVFIDEQGRVIASFSNNESQALYQLPLADFASPEGLTPLSGNVFSQSGDSGEANLREAGTNGLGVIRSNSIEQSNVELSEELTDIIIAQRSYQANTRVISTTDELLEQLNQL